MVVCIGCMRSLHIPLDSLLARLRLRTAHPVRPERLRTEGHHLRIEVDEHRLVALQPGLEAHQMPRRSRPPATRMVDLPPRTRGNRAPVAPTDHESVGRRYQ